MQGWLLLSFFICLHNQLISFDSIIVQISEKRVIHQVYSKIEWLLLLVTFTAKLELVFVLIFRLRVFILKPTERAHVLLQKGTRDFQNSPPFKRLARFYVTISESFKRFQYFNFETNFLESEICFQKTGVPLFS